MPLSSWKRAPLKVTLSSPQGKTYPLPLWERAPEGRERGASL